MGAEIDVENEDIQEQEAVEEQVLEASEEDQTDSTQNNARAARIIPESKNILVAPHISL